MAKHTAFFLIVLAIALPRCAGNAQSPSAGGAVTRSRAEIESLIEKVGKTPPDWWDSTPLTYPPTLDLSWPMRADGPWDARKNVGQYLWDVINPNPGRWKEGIKLVNHLMIRHKDDPEKLVRAMETLGHMYHNLSEDWARAAFWWRTADRYGGYVDPVGLAHCYWKLGSKEMAVALLVEVGSDYTRHGAVIKLWADMGEYDKALALAERKAAEGMPVIAYLTAGDTCRLAGRYHEALAYYQKVLTAVGDARSEGDVKKDKERAQASIQAIRLFDTLDVAQVADGASERLVSGPADERRPSSLDPAGGPNLLPRTFGTPVLVLLRVPHGRLVLRVQRAAAE